MITSSSLPEKSNIAAHPDEFLGLLWHLLDLGVKSADSEFHLGVLASGTAHELDARTVVLRKTNPAHRLLRFHTDKRSPKCRQIAENSRVVWVFYDKARRLQLRLIGEAAVSDGEIAPPPEKAWSNYSTTQPPGTPLTPQECPWSSQRDAESAVLANFCSYDVRIQEMEFLHLAREGALRGIFRFQPDGTTAFTFLTP